MRSSRRTLAAIAGALLAVVLAVAVAGMTWSWSGSRSTANDPSWVDSLEDVQGRWVSVSGFAYDGTRPWAVPVTLTVDGTSIGLHADCNHIAATVAVREHRLHADGGVAMTAMGCDQTRQARDAWLAALVEEHAAMQLKGSMFLLGTGAGWIGFERAGGAGPVVTDPVSPVVSTQSP